MTDTVLELPATRPTAAPTHPAPESGATVLAFPAARSRAPSPETRLARALASLQAALAEQREAAHALQDASARLRTTLGELHGRLSAHQHGLGRLAEDVAGVNAQARRLEAWADSALAAGHGTAAPPAKP